MRQWIGPIANRFRDLLIQTYGPEVGASVQLAEAFEISEYGGKLDDQKMAHLFPFLPSSKNQAAKVPDTDWVDVRDDE